MKMDEFWAKKAAALVEQVRLIHGGVGCSGIAVTVSVCVTSRAQNPTDISI